MRERLQSVPQNECKPAASSRKHVLVGLVVAIANLRKEKKCSKNKCPPSTKTAPYSVREEKIDEWDPPAKTVNSGVNFPQRPLFYPYPGPRAECVLHSFWWRSSFWMSLDWFLDCHFSECATCRERWARPSMVDCKGAILIPSDSFWHSGFSFSFLLISFFPSFVFLSHTLPLFSFFICICRPPMLWLWVVGLLSRFRLLGQMKNKQKNCPSNVILLFCMQISHARILHLQPHLRSTSWLFSFLFLFVSLQLVFETHVGRSWPLLSVKNVKTLSIVSMDSRLPVVCLHRWLSLHVSIVPVDSKKLRAPFLSLFVITRSPHIRPSSDWVQSFCQSRFLFCWWLLGGPVRWNSRRPSPHFPGFLFLACRS